MLSIVVFGVSETARNCHMVHLNMVLNGGQCMFGGPPCLGPMMGQAVTNQSDMISADPDTI